MNDFPFDTVALTSDVIDWFNDTYQTLKARFGIQLTGNIDFQLEQFEIFRNYTDIKLRGSFVIRHENRSNDCYVLFVEAYERVQAKYELLEVPRNQVWALAYVKHDFGRVLIRRETLADKIMELVHPIELDFKDDKPFSDTFYVLVNDRNKAAMAINRNFRNAVMDIRADDFSIEVAGHNLIIGNRNPVSPERAVYLAEFVSRVCSFC